MEKIAYESDGFYEIVDDIKSLMDKPIDEVDEKEFNDVMKKEFKYQYQNNKIYQQCCKNSFDIDDPGDIDHYIEIPPVPTDFFKKYEFFTFPEDMKSNSKLFETSGTTGRRNENGNRLPQGRLWRDPITLSLLDKRIEKSIKEFVLPEAEDIKAYYLSPPPEGIPTSPMGYNFSKEADLFSKNGGIFLYENGELNKKRLVDNLRKDEKTGERVSLTGASFGFVNFFDFCEERDISFNLNPKSVIVDGGGYKNYSRKPSREEFLELGNTILGIDKENIINVYGCSEVATTDFENKKVKKQNEKVCMPQLPWKRTKIYDIESFPELEEIDCERKGLIAHYDLIDLGNVSAVLTDDVGHYHGSGFKIQGKASSNKAKKKFQDFMKIFSSGINESQFKKYMIDNN